MTRADRRPLLAFLVTLAAIGALFVALWAGTGLSQGITVSTQGTPVVGADFRFLVTVRMTDVEPSRMSYLSLEGLNGSFEVTGSDGADHPWGRPNIWNLTGMDLSYGRTFRLDTVPVWGAQIVLHASVWSIPFGFGAVRFVNGDRVDPSTVSSVLAAEARVTIAWPLEASVTPEGPLVLGQAMNLHISVRQRIAVPQVSGPLYLSLATKLTYYRLVGVDPGENPWHLTTFWNLTGLDLFDGVQVSLSATPALAAKGVPLDVLVWSPRGSLNDVRLDENGTVLNPGAVRFWSDTTFSFPVASS